MVATDLKGAVKPFYLVRSYVVHVPFKGLSVREFCGTKRFVLGAACCRIIVCRIMELHNAIPNDYFSYLKFVV